MSIRRPHRYSRAHIEESWVKPETPKPGFTPSPKGVKAPKKLGNRVAEGEHPIIHQVMRGVMKGF